MSNGKGYALVIISLIIGAAGVGMGVYSALTIQVLEGPQGDPGADGIGIDGVNGTLNNVVGVWESIDGGPSIAFPLEFSDILVNESEFFTLDPSYNLTLNQAGWYRVNIKFRWTDLLSTETYSFFIEKNGVGEHVLEFLYHPSLSAHIVDTFVYIYSDGNDYFNFVCLNTGLADSTSITTTQTYNQFVLEYVKEA
ncbi:MAG: hypothetical protein ACTSRD_09575 [Promethearchaeota archaeon]